MTQPYVILNNLAGLQNSNFEVFDVKVFKDHEIWNIKRRPQAKPICNNCGLAYEHKPHSVSTIDIIDQPAGRFKRTWRVERAKLSCPCTLSILVEKLDFKAEQHLMTQRFVNHIEELLCTKMFTVADVSRMFNLDYGIVYKIDHQVLLRLIQHHKLVFPTHISVDEKSARKGHNYITIVSDLETGEAIWATEGNSKESLDLFFQVIGPEGCAKIQTVSKDLWKPYTESCNEYIPHAIQNADKFHVIKKLIDSVDAVRKDVQNDKSIIKEQRSNAKSSMWLVRHNQENMEDYQREKLEELQKINEPLYKAYLMKEAFFEVYNFAANEISKAEKFINEWITDVSLIGLEPMNEFCNFLKRNIQMILNSIATKKTSALSEGINRKINVLKSMAYGYKCMDYFKLKILQRCGSLGSNWTPAQ